MSQTDIYDTPEGQLVVKRQRTEIAVTTSSHEMSTVKRYSNLHAPIMLLTGDLKQQPTMNCTLERPGRVNYITLSHPEGGGILWTVGHGAAVCALEFSPDGQAVASGSSDKTLFLWSVYGECSNYAVLIGHKNTVLEVHWTTDSEHLISASADKTVRAWDVEAGIQIKKMAEHNTFVNSCNVARRGPEMIVTCADDGLTKMWDLRVKRSVATMTDVYPLTAVAFSDATDQIFVAGIETVIKTWDVRNQKVVTTMVGHSDTVTGLQLNPAGTHLLSNSMDNTLRVWDIRPYAPRDRCVDVFVGHTHNFEKNLLRCSWSPDGRHVTCGSADRMVYIWEVESKDLLYKLPGHTGSVNEVVFHPRENIIGSASSDKKIYLGDLDL